MWKKLIKWWFKMVIGGYQYSRLERAGTTITTRSSHRRDKAWNGGKSTSLGTSSDFSRLSVWLLMSSCLQRANDVVWHWFVEDGMYSTSRLN